MSRRAQSSCDECGWTSKPCRSEAQADHAYRLHSCELQRRRREAAERHAARMGRVDRTPRTCRHTQTTHVHATYACYVLDGCRCWPCAKAKSAYENNRARQQAYGRWTSFVDAQPARDHVRALMAAGMGWKRIADLSGVSTGALSKLLYGVRRPDGQVRPSERIRPETERALLATSLELAGGAVVDPTGTVRRIRALVAIGWSQSKIAAELGMLRSNFTRIAQQRTEVTTATEQAVRELYDRWSMTLPPADTHSDKISVNRARAYAQERGWAPPLAWDEDTIDDPVATPAGVVTEDDPGIDEVAIQRRIAGDRTVQLSHAERVALVEQLTCRGMSSRTIAELTGYTPRTVVRLRADTTMGVAA